MVARLTLLPFLLMLPICVNQVHSVKGCVTFVTGDDYTEKASICDRFDTRFTRIPSTLPKEVVRLTINHQIIHVLDRRQFQHLPNLTYLNLDSNKLSVIKRDAFLLVPTLRELSVRFNHLTLSVESFHPDALTSVNALEVLNLMRNPIGRVPAHYFYPMRKSLRSLVLAGANSDFHISTEALEGLFALELLDLSYNNLESMPSSFNGLFTTMQLKQLYLFGNPWRCDCALRWLREWADKHNTTQLFIDPRQVDVNGYVNDPLLQMEPAPLENAAFPKCASPPRLAGRPLFPIPSVQANPIHPFEMACPPHPKQSLFTVHGKVGENLTLTCDFEASSVDEVLWYKNGNPLPASSRIRVRQVHHGQVSVELLFYKMRESDIGTYICLAKNDFGKANITILLTRLDSKWVRGAYSDSDFIGWLDYFNSNVVLKYTSIAAVVLVLILISVGTIVYFSCRRNPKNVVKALTTTSHSKTSFTELAPLNGIHPVAPDNSIACRRTQPPRYSPSPDMTLTQHHQSYVLSFQDSHPLYSMAEHGTMDLSGSCPVHGMPKTSSSFIVNGKTFDSGSPRFNTLDKKTAGYRDTEPMSSSQMPEVMTTSTAYSPLVLVKETTSPNSADYVLCPKHGNVLASLSSSTNDSSHAETPLSPTVRTTRTIKLHPFTPTSKNSTLKPKHVEFAEEPSSTFGAAVPTTPPTNKSGFSTTV